jgi:hypothetical protein
LKDKIENDRKPYEGVEHQDQYFHLLRNGKEKVEIKFKNLEEKLYTTCENKQDKKKHVIMYRINIIVTAFIRFILDKVGDQTKQNKFFIYGFDFYIILLYIVWNKTLVINFTRLLRRIQYLNGFLYDGDLKLDLNHPLNLDLWMILRLKFYDNKFFKRIICKTLEEMNRALLINLLYGLCVFYFCYIKNH